MGLRLFFFGQEFFSDHLHRSVDLTRHGMRFLITNDDGFDAPGLVALFQALRPHGDVIVVAPETCHSSKGHAVDTKSPIRVERRNVDPFGQIHIVHSSPADCVRVGLCHILQQPPDFVIAGINPGANLGVDLFYSGTAAAAREAALMNVPAIALSRYLSPGFPVNWDRLSQHASRVVRVFLDEQYRLPAGHFWNINFPAMANEEYPDEITFVPHGTDPHAIAFQVIESDDSSELLAYSANYRDRGRSDLCDVKHLFEDRLTATAVGPQSTAHRHFPPHPQVSLSNATFPI